MKDLKDFAWNILEVWYCMTCLIIGVVVMGLPFWLFLWGVSWLVMR